MGDIFQKFKLSFNLLAKLKAHIHDPNAPELVHFLFTPLALIVDASHDSQYGPNLPTKVLAPLLTKSAVDLLINCLTNKEKFDETSSTSSDKYGSQPSPRMHAQLEGEIVPNVILALKRRPP